MKTQNPPVSTPPVFLTKCPHISTSQGQHPGGVCLLVKAVGRHLMRMKSQKHHYYWISARQPDYHDRITMTRQQPLGTAVVLYCTCARAVLLWQTSIPNGDNKSHKTVHVLSRWSDAVSKALKEGLPADFTAWIKHVHLIQPCNSASLNRCSVLYSKHVTIHLCHWNVLNTKIPCLFTACNIVQLKTVV